MSLVDEEPINNLRKLQEGSGTDLLGNLFDLFAEGTPVAVEKMKTLIADENYEDLAREAHSLKSSSANLGAAKLSSLCKEIEYKILDADSYDPEEIKKLVKEVDDIHVDTVTQLKQAIGL